MRTSCTQKKAKMAKTLRITTDHPERGRGGRAQAWAVAAAGAGAGGAAEAVGAESRVMGRTWLAVDERHGLEVGEGPDDREAEDGHARSELYE